MTNGLVHHYHLGELTFILGASRVTFIFFFFFFGEFPLSKQNSRIAPFIKNNYQNAMKIVFALFVVYNYQNAMKIVFALFVVYISSTVVSVTGVCFWVPM